MSELNIEEEDKRKNHCPGKVYFTRAEGTDDVKVGRAYDPQIRKSQLQTGNSKNLVVEFSYPTPQPVKFETQIHADLAHINIRGEWFTLPHGTDYQKIAEDAEEKLKVLNEDIKDVTGLRQQC